MNATFLAGPLVPLSRCRGCPVANRTWRCVCPPRAPLANSTAPTAPLPPPLPTPRTFPEAVRAFVAMGLPKGLAVESAAQLNPIAHRAWVLGGAQGL